MYFAIIAKHLTEICELTKKKKYLLLIFNRNSQIIPNSFEPMKTKLFIIIAVGMVSNAMFGQISVRPYAGMSISKFTYCEREAMMTVDRGAPKFKPGLNLGIDVDFPINDVISIETGLSYIDKGAKYSKEKEEFDFKWKFTSSVHIGYFGLPVMLKMQKEVGDIKLSVFGGPSMLFKLNDQEKYKIEFFDGISNMVEEFTESGNVENQFDVNLNIGGRIEYNNFNLGITYLHGLTDISLGENVKNTSVLINIGYRIEL